MRLPPLPAADVLAALTAVALLAPETVAFAQIAGVPPARGLAAAPLCVLVYAVVGRQRQLLVGATAATAVISSAAVSGLSDDPVRRAGLTAALTLLTGALLLVTGGLRCGWIARFLAPEALQGFLFGLAVVIVVRQLALLVDVRAPRGDVFRRGWELARSVHAWSATSLATGLACLALLVLLERRLPRVPATVVVLALAAAVSAALHLGRHGVAHVARVPAGLPRLVAPHLSGPALLHLLATAAGLALVCFALGHGVAVRLHGDAEARVDPDREMLGLGLANLVAGAVGGPAVTASPSASSAARQAGARTAWLSVLTAGLLLVVAVALAPASALLPEPALGAVVIMAVRPFLSLAPSRTYLRHDLRSLVVAGSAVVGVTTLTLVPGLVVAVAASLVLFVADASRLRVSELPAGPAVTVLRPDGALFFATTGPLVDAVDAHLARPGRGADLLVLDLAASVELPLAVVDALETVRRHVERCGGALALVDVLPPAAGTLATSALRDVPVFADLSAAAAVGRVAGPRPPTAAAEGPPALALPATAPP